MLSWVKMKIAGRILALLIAGVVSVLMVQRVFRRLYEFCSGNYIDLPLPDDSEDGSGAA